MDRQQTDKNNKDTEEQHDKSGKIDNLQHIFTISLEQNETTIL